MENKGEKTMIDLTRMHRMFRIDIYLVYPCLNSLPFSILFPLSPYYKEVMKDEDLSY
jgi:hypothetical protein